MKPRHLLLLLLGPLFLACPYDSAVPLPHDRALPIDTALIGRWQAPQDDNRTPIDLDIFAFSATDYFVEFRDQGGQVSRLRAFAVKVGTMPLLCTQAIDELELDREWLFFAYQLTPEGELVVRAVSADIVKDKTDDGTKLLGLLEKQAKKPGFLEEATTLGRKPAAS